MRYAVALVLLAASAAADCPNPNTACATWTVDDPAGVVAGFELGWRRSGELDWIITDVNDAAARETTITLDLSAELFPVTYEFALRAYTASREERSDWSDIESKTFSDVPDPQNFQLEFNIITRVDAPAAVLELAGRHSELRGDSYGPAPYCQATSCRSDADCYGWGCVCVYGGCAGGTE